jgi:hypothetical protein
LYKYIATSVLTLLLLSERNTCIRIANAAFTSAFASLSPAAIFSPFIADIYSPTYVYIYAGVYKKTFSFFRDYVAVRN